MDEKIKNARILAVDDSPENLDILGWILEDTEYQLIFANNGAKALKAAESEQPDLILLDVIMPEMDGFETCKKLKSSPITQHIPVIFLSAKTESENILKGFEAGAIDYLTKPFVSSELLARVQTHLEIKFSREMIQNQKDALNRLVHILCHDLSNPMQALMTTFELSLKNPELLENNKSQLFRYCTRAVKLIQLVRTLSALEENKVKLELEPVNLKQAVLESMDTLSHLIAPKNISMEVKIPDNQEIIAEKTSLINSVLNNIITNAVKFSHPDSKIEILSRRENGGIVLSIKDYGIGIPEDLMNHIFMIDKESVRPGTKQETGTGFGLSLLKSFTSLYGGTVEISSQEETPKNSNHGTEVSVTFKSAESDQENSNTENKG